MNALISYKAENFTNQTRPVAISEIYVASEHLFLSFCQKPLEDFHFISHFRDRMYEQDGVKHCLLLLGENHPDGVLIEAEGYDYARYTSYLPGGDFIFKGMAQCMLMDIYQAIGSESPYALLTFASIKEKYGLAIDKGTNAAAMLMYRFGATDELSSVDITEDGIAVELSPEYMQLWKTEEQEPALGDIQ